MQYFVHSKKPFCAIVGKFVKKVKRPQKSFHFSKQTTEVFFFKLGFQHGPGLTDKLLSIKSDLDPVVEEGKEGGEGEGGNEDGDEPELENHLEVLLEQALVVHQAVVQVDLGGALPTCFWSKVL